MTALVRLQLATFLHSQRYLPPSLLYFAMIGVFSSNDDGPLPPVYGPCAAALFVCSAWLTVALTSTDDPAQRAIVVVSAGRSVRVLLSSIAVAALGSLLLGIVGLVVPLMLGNHVVAPLELAVGGLAYLGAAATGTAVGLFCSRQVFHRPGYALVAALVLVLVFLFAPNMPPVNLLLRTMSAPADVMSLFVPVSGCLALGLVLLALSAGATEYIAVRRD